MTWQIREYTVKSGEMEAWIAEWREKIVPLRERAGFKVFGAWTVDGSDQFIWIIGYEGPKSWQEAEAGYYHRRSARRWSPTPPATSPRPAGA